MGPITIAVTNYNGEQTLRRTLESARAMAGPATRILVVDDGSTDGSPGLVESYHPEVELVRMPTHTARLNRVRNAALEASSTRLVFLIDNDVTFDERCLEELARAMDSLPGAAVCTPLILRSDDRQTIYSSGHRLHYLCVSTDDLRDASADLLPDRPRLGVGGGIQLIDKEALATVGYFDESFVIGWGDDGELHHRVNLSGLGCYSVPTALAYHPPRQRLARTYGQLHNRWLTLLQSYSLRTLVVLLPALMAYELVLLAFLASRRQLGDYFRALRAVVASRSRWSAERRRIKSLRRRPDRELLTSGSIYVPQMLLRRGWERTAIRLLDSLFTLYWRGFAWLL